VIDAYKGRHPVRFPGPLQLNYDFRSKAAAFYGARFENRTMEASERPVTPFLDLLGRRWALRVVWAIRRDAVAFSELRQRLQVSPSVLTQRLSELQEAGVVERDTMRRYRLTASGRDLARVLYDLNRWAEQASQTAAAGPAA
jgi:DNA-binding HxlR family transcriptional regulator